MKVDGIYGGVTANWIRKFQIDIMFSNRSIYADDRVDRIRNTTTMQGSLSKTTYTLTWLNWLVAYYEPLAFAQTPAFVPLQNPNNVPPPSNDIVIQQPPEPVPATGGF